MQPITANFLITKQDFYAWKRASCRAQLRWWEPMCARMFGGLLAAFGVCGLCLFPGAFVKAACAVILFGSIGVALYYDVLYPYWLNRRIAAVWETARPQTYCMEFFEDRFTVGSERYQAELSYAMLRRVYEDENVFLLDMGAGEVRFVPKRTLSAEEQDALRNYFRKAKL